MLFIEATVASVIVLLITAMSSPADLGVPELGVHPVWLPITLFAARYGARGLAVSLIAMVVPLLLMSLLWADSTETLMSRVHNPSDVLALFTAVAAAWIGMSQSSRVRRISRELEAATDSSRRANASVAELTSTVQTLRARCDRMDTSLTVWRDLANRLESGTPTEAAHAALELCGLRCGASAGIVHRARAESDVAPIIARLGSWTLREPRPSELWDDVTVRAAASSKEITCGAEVEGADAYDSDIAIPIAAERDGELLGVVALRGVDPTRLRAAELRDLSLIADWLSAPMERVYHKPRLRAVQEEV